MFCSEPLCTPGSGWPSLWGPGALKVSGSRSKEVSGPGSFGPAPPPPLQGQGLPVHFAHGRTAGQLPRVLGLSHPVWVMLTRLAVALVPGGTALALWMLHTSLQSSAHPRPDFFSAHHSFSAPRPRARANLWARRALTDGGVGEGLSRSSGLLARDGLPLGLSAETQRVRAPGHMQPGEGA